MYFLGKIIICDYIVRIKYVESDKCLLSLTFLLNITPFLNIATELFAMC